MSIEIETYPGKFMVIWFTLDDQEMIIEPLASKDLDKAYLLFQQGIKEGLLLDRSYDQFVQLVDNLVACICGDGTVVGIAGLVPYPKNCAEVTCFCVDKNFRGKEIASRLLYALSEEAEVNNCYEFVFACTVMEAPKKFFESQGFVEASRDQIPKEKWDNYPVDRNPQVLIKRPKACS